MNAFREQGAHDILRLLSYILGHPVQSVFDMLDGDARDGFLMLVNSVCDRYDNYH